MVLGFFAGTTYARNVQLMLPIAAALEAKDIPDRPTGLVKFFFGIMGPRRDGESRSTEGRQCSREYRQLLQEA